VSQIALGLCVATVLYIVKSFVKNGALTPQGVCLLLGLAVAVALEANVGRAAALFLRDYDKRVVEAARAERAEAEQASAAASAIRG